MTLLKKELVSADAIIQLWKTDKEKNTMPIVTSIATLTLYLGCVRDLIPDFCVLVGLLRLSLIRKDPGKSSTYRKYHQENYA